MRNLAFNMELCLRTMALGVDKMCVVLHLTEFSMFNNPPMKVTRETIEILATCYPETLGHAVFIGAPRYFRAFFATVSPLIDKKVRSKIIFADGPDERVAELLLDLIGPDWK